MTTDRTQVNIRLERELLAALDEMAAEESLDRTELARRLLRDGLKRERIALALRRYRNGEVSVARAAEQAQISLYEMLDRIRTEGIPYDLDSDELARLDGVIEGSRRPAAVGERRAHYGIPRTRPESGVDELRALFRPKVVQWLFVGESSPAGGTHFYRANSHLFRAMRDAFAGAFGNDVPTADAFLHFFRDQGDWLVDLADRPVNRLDEGERAAAVTAGIDRLATTIAATRPKRIIAVKTSIENAVRQAAAAARFEGDIEVLPFPVRQWRTIFVKKLAAALHARPRTPGATSRPRGST